MKTVKMKTVSTGPKGNREINVEYTLEDADAQELIDGGFADEVKSAESPEVEVAIKPEPENAAARTRPARKRPARKRGKKG